MKNQQSKGLFREVLEVVSDVAGEVKAVADGSKQVGPAAALWNWLQTDKSIRGTFARSIILTQCEPELALVLGDHWRSKGLAIKVVNRNPPQVGGSRG